jgi:hypothetical protein
MKTLFLIEGDYRVAQQNFAVKTAVDTRMSESLFGGSAPEAGCGSSFEHDDVVEP